VSTCRSGGELDSGLVPMHSRDSALGAVASPTPSNDDECPTTCLCLGEVDLIELSARSEVVIRCEEESGSQVKESDMDDNSCVASGSVDRASPRVTSGAPEKWPLEAGV